MAFYSKARMSETETIVAFCDGAKKSISAARELAQDTGNPVWMQIAQRLDDLRQSGYQLAHMKAMRKAEIETAIDLKLGKKH